MSERTLQNARVNFHTAFMQERTVYERMSS